MPRGRHRKPTNTARNMQRAGAGGLTALALSATYPAGSSFADAPTDRIPVTPQLQNAAIVPTYKATPSTQAPFKLQVVAGDTISELALHDLGLHDWHPLYEQNRAVVGGNPDLIFPGQNLTYSGKVSDPPPVKIVEKSGTEKVVPAPEAPRFGSAPIVNSHGPVSPRAQAAADKVFAQVPGASLITIGGTRASARDMNGHPSGNALDYMVMRDSRLGDAIVQYHIDHWDELGVEYIIWQQRIRSTPTGPWRIMEDRGSATQNHVDHTHVNYR